MDSPPAIVQPAAPAPGTLEAEMLDRAEGVMLDQHTLADKAHAIALAAIRQAASLRVELRMLQAENTRLREELAAHTPSRRTLVRNEATRTGNR